MAGGRRDGTSRRRVAPVLVLVVASVFAQCWQLFSILSPAAAQVPSSRPLRVALMVSSDKPPATGPEEAHAIRAFVAARATAINAAGGVGGRPLEVVVYDDLSDAEGTRANVARALADPDVFAMIGIWSSTRGAGVVREIGESGLPFISEMSVEALFAPYPNIYTLTRSVADEQEVFKSFALERYRRIAFVGDADDLYTRAYFEHVAQPGHELGLMPPVWLSGNLDEQRGRVDEVIDGLKASGVDLVFLSVGSKRGAAFLDRMTAAGLELPVFLGLGSISGVLADPSGAGHRYKGPLYEVAEGGIANLNNERLERLMRRNEREGGGRRFSPYATGYGARYADLLALVAEAAAARPDSARSARSAVLERLASLAEGRRVWRGIAQDWSFSRVRASAERSLVVWRPPGQPTSILAPSQFVRMAGVVRKVPVVNMHLDMIRIYDVDSAQKSFEAEFFVTLRGTGEVPISAIEFTNAVRGPGSGAALVNIREVHSEPGSGLVDGSARVYRISGRFAFEPDLAKYPFDEQIFSISFQPSTTAATFLLQPPADDVRRQEFNVDGWRIKSHYVGSNDLIIRSIGGMMNEARVIPYYNFNFTWVMQRQVIDYMLRVIVPLAFIMLVAYIANFIPRSEFEAIVAIQVTALLSAIALYLALAQPQADSATLSDIIFVVAYAAISTMIAFSVLEVNATVATMPRLLRVIHVAQMYLVPVAAVWLITYVLVSASGSEGVMGLAQEMWRRAVAAAAAGGA